MPRIVQKQPSMIMPAISLAKHVASFFQNHGIVETITWKKVKSGSTISENAALKDELKSIAGNL